MEETNNKETKLEEEVLNNDQEENEEQEIDELTKLKDTVLLQKEQIDEQDDRIKRLMAEFDNFKKRSSKEREGLYNSLVSDIFTSLLPVIDNLEKAASLETEDKAYKEGIELVLKQFKDVLNSNGVEEIESVGQPFNPEYHEAVGMVEDNTLGEKIIKEEYRKGYKIGNKVIRHSMVIVAN